MPRKEKNQKASLFSFRNAVYLSIIFTCILAIGNITQDILFDIQAVKTIEVTREITYIQVVTATPSPLTPAATYAYRQTPCTRDDLLQAIEAGGSIFFDCNGVVQFDAPIIIRNHVHLIGAGELLTSLSQSRDLAVLFVIENGGNLVLENISIRDIRGTVVEIHEDGTFSGQNCRIIGNGREDMVSTALIINQGAANFSRCVIEKNVINSGAMFWQSFQSRMSFSETVFQANRIGTGNFTGEGSLIENSGGDLIMDAAYFYDNIGQNAENWIIRSRSGETNMGRSLFRNNRFELLGYMIENESASMMYLDTVSMLSNPVGRGFYIQNAGNLRIVNAGMFDKTCSNTGILNDIAGQCQN